jgi:hypothetical protein
MTAVLDEQMNNFGTYASGVLPGKGRMIQRRIFVAEYILPEIDSTQPASHIPSHDLQSAGMGQSLIETPTLPGMGASHEILSSPPSMDSAKGLGVVSPGREESTKREQTFPFQQSTQPPSVSRRSMDISFLLSPVDYD